MIKASPAFFIFLILLPLLQAKTNATAKPDQVIEIFRHGARGPQHDYDSSWEPFDYSNLTPVGMRQHFILGKVLAEKYPHLLGTDYNYTQVYMLSDSIPRCIQSGISHFYGMYINTGPSLKKDYPREKAVPPFQDARVKNIANSLPNAEALLYNNVPNIMDVINVTQAYIFKPNGLPYCPNSQIWEAANEKDARAQEGLKIFEETMKQLNKYMDNSTAITGLRDLKGLGEVAMCDLYDNRPIPFGINDNQELVTNLTYAYSWAGFHIWGGQEIQRQLYGFGLIDSMIKQLTAFRQGKDYYPVAMYSGHDSNLYAVLAAFGVLTEDCLLENFKSLKTNKTLPNPNCYFPYFASNLVVEFYNTTVNPYVKFFYNNALIPLCNGKETCGLDEFITFARKATGNINLAGFYLKCGAPKEWMSQEQSVNVELKKEINLMSWMKFSSDQMIIAGLVTLCALLFAKIVYDSKKSSKVIQRLKEELIPYREIKEVAVE